jgi:hypothetical protein
MIKPTSERTWIPRSLTSEAIVYGFKLSQLWEHLGFCGVPDLYPIRASFSHTRNAANSESVSSLCPPSPPRKTVLIVIVLRLLWEITLILFCWKSRDSSGSIALGYGLDDQGSRVRLPAETGNFSLHHRVHNGSGAHPASYPMGTGDSFSGGGVKWQGCEADHSPPSSAELKEYVELYLRSPNMPSWLSAQLKHRDNFTLPYLTLPYLTWKHKW